MAVDTTDWTRRSVLWTIGGTAIAGTLLSGGTGEATGQSREAWPQFGYDNANTGYAPGNTGPVEGIEEQWSFQVGDEVLSSPAVVDGTVYVGSSDNNVYALDAKSGNEQWSFQTGGPVASSPAIVDGTVYIGSRYNVYALDAESGTEQWSFQTGSTVSSSPAVVNGTVYVGSHDDDVYALDAESGDFQWSFQTGDRVWIPPAVVDGTVYVGSPDNNVYALDAESGDEQWSFQTGDQVWTPPTEVDGTVYVGSHDNYVYALDAESGDEQWSFQTGDQVWSTAAANNTVYVGSFDGNVYALDTESGTEQWSFQTGNAVSSMSAVVDSTVYLGSQDNNVYALDAESGTEQWSFQTEDSVDSSPAVVNGTVYVGSFDGSVYAITGRTTAQRISYGAPVMHYSTDDDPPQHATNFTVQLDPEVTFGGESEYAFEVERVDTGQSVRFEPNVSQEITASNASLLLYDGDGTLLDPPEIDLDGRKTLSVTGGNDWSDIFSSGDVFGTYIVHLLKNGERIDSMKEKQIGIGYEGEFVQHSTSGEIEVTFPIEDEVDDSWYVEFYIDDHGDSPPSNLVEETEMERDEERGQFASTFQSDDLDSVDEDSVPRGEIRFFANGNPYEAEEYYEPNLWLGFSIELSSAVETVIFQQFSDAVDSPLFWALGGLTGAGVGYAGYRRLNSEEDSSESHDEDRSIATEKPTNREQEDIEPVVTGYEDLELLDTVKTSPTIRIRRAETADRRLWVLEPNIEAEGTLDTSTIDRLVNKIEPWSQMDSHPNLLSVFKTGTEPFPWAVIESADYPTLLDHVDELSMIKKLEAIQEICDAVHHVYRYGTTYESLTTASVLYSDGSDIKLQGILDQFQEENAWYKAPEEFETKSTERSVVYRLGLITYELLTEELPYPTYPDGTPKEAIKANDLVQLSEKDTNLSPELNRILAKSLSKSPKDRYETVLHFRDDLRSLNNN